MKTSLTKEQIEIYRRDGALVYEDLLNDREVAELLQAVSDAVLEMGAKKSPEKAF